MRNALLALTLLAAGCASAPEPEVVTTHQSQQQTQVVQKHVEVSPSLELVGEPTPVPPRPQAAQATTPTPPTTQSTPSTRQMAREALNRIDEIEATQQNKVDFLQVGPPVVITTVPTPEGTPSPIDQPPAPQPTPTPAYVAPAVPTPEPFLDTAPGLTYQNGGPNGTTGPLTTPSPPTLPTAEGFEYRP